MSYGNISPKIVNHYNKVTYTLDGTQYKDIHIFKTDPSKESVAPAVYVNGDKQLMKNMNPPGISPSKVIAKINATPMIYGKDKDAFYGLYYVNSTLYKDCKKLTGTSDPSLDNLHKRYYPCLCVKKDEKTDEAVKVRWFTKANLPIALPYCSSIIGTAHPLVYNSNSVFENVVYDDEVPSMRIADWNNLDSGLNRFNNEICGKSAASNTNRTFIGYKPDGSFLMVCADTARMNLRVGAKLMVDLECKYACNEDGATGVKMRVASGYTNGHTAGQMTSGGTDYYGSAICAYLK